MLICEHHGTEYEEGGSCYFCDPDADLLDDLIGPDDPRPTIDAGIGDLMEASKAAQIALEMANRPPRYFSHGGELVRIEADDEGRPFTRPLGAYRLLHHLARAARYVRLDPKGVAVETRPPMDVVHDLLASPDRMWPVMRRIVTVPVFALDGTICQAPGYNAPAAAWYHPNGLVVPEIVDEPSDVEVAQAVDLINEVIVDFPFVGDADRAHAISMMLQPFARDLIVGPTPLHLVEKPSPGTGATLLVTATLWPALGHPPKAFTEATNEEEWRKRITSTLRESPDAVLIENLHGKLQAASLAAVLTIDEWGDRLLGVSEMTRLPVRCLWAASANNPQLSTELLRRTIRIRMDAGVEHPWEREPDTFRHPDLREWLGERRSDLVAACLILVRRWIADGRPSGPVSLGMFESWAKTMGGILGVAGIPGFLENRQEFYEAMSEDDQNLGAFVAVWTKKFPNMAVGVADLMVLAAEHLDLGSGSDRSQRTILGNLLKANKDRRFGDLFIRRSRTVQGAAQWKVDGQVAL